MSNTSFGVIKILNLTDDLATVESWQMMEHGVTKDDLLRIATNSAKL
jgi:hypothetical protein